MKIFLNSLGSLIYPQSCLGCHGLISKSDERESKSGFTTSPEFCKKCRGALQLDVKTQKRDGLQILSSLPYTPQVSRVILAAKEDNNLIARNWLAQVMQKAVFVTKFLATATSEIILVPIPSRSTANRSRGYLHTQLLAESLVRKLSATVEGEGIKFRVSNILVHTHRVRDQTKLSAFARSKNMHDSMKVIANSRIYSSRLGDGELRKQMYEPILIEGKVNHFLIDDLVTTGSTLAAAKSTLMNHGIEVTGSICAASRLDSRDFF